MTTTTATTTEHPRSQRRAFCSSCVLDREIDPQTGRCLTCGYQAAKLSTEPKHNGNDGAPPRAPSRAYRDLSAPFNAANSVAVVAAQPVVEEPKETATVRPSTDRTVSAVASAEAPAAAAPPPPPPPPPTAPTNGPSPQWLSETRALAERFTAEAKSADRRAEEALAQAQAHKAEAARLRKSAAVFTQILGALPDADSKAGPPAASTPNGKTAKRWATLHDHCIDCGKTDQPHAAHGRCRDCDRRWRSSQIS